MDRVVKRFLLHNHNDSDEIKESDFEEVRQDIQEIRIEMANNVRAAKESLMSYMTRLHKGINLIGEHFVRDNSGSSHLEGKLLHFRANSFGMDFDEEMDENDAVDFVSTSCHSIEQ